MKKLKIMSFMLLIACIATACSESSKIESAAKQQMEATFKEMAKDPSSVKLSNMETVYNDDSLCIIHVDFTAKNGLGNDITNRTEYIYISSNGKNYEAFQNISNEEDGVFVSPEKFDKSKTGTIYSELSYKEGLRYLAAVYVNNEGREVGNKEYESFTIPVPTGTGSWELNAYKDEFGEVSDDKYLVLTGSGVFSNSATTDSKMTAVFFIDKFYNFSIRLIEYNSSVVKSDDTYDYRIKDSSGQVHEIKMYNSETSGEMRLWNKEDNEIMKDILSKEGVVTFSVKERFAYSTPDTYLFKLDFTGFAKAMSLL